MIQPTSYAPPALAAVDNLVDLLSERAAHSPEKVVFAFFADGENVSLQYTFDELDRHARAIAAELQRRNLSGERAMLLFPSGIEYLAAFFGCLYAGVVAVPVYPPQMGRQFGRIASISQDSQAALFFCSRSVYETLAQHGNDELNVQDGEWLIMEDISFDGASAWKRPAVAAETLAFLQYTSGSTGNPKGVMVTHGNLMHNERMIYDGFGSDSDYIYVSWLPLFHDMGLIGNALQAVYAGITINLISPTTFLQRPIRWLRLISETKARVAGAPNFAYDLCVARCSDEDIAGLDLSHWVIAFNGAEPVRPETLRRFTEKFAPANFQAKAHYPCYGMAETTLMVSGGSRDEDAVFATLDAEQLEQGRAVAVGVDFAGATRELASSGRVQSGQNLCIVQPDTLEVLPEGQIGEIWIQGPSICQGYWQRPEATEETFGAHLRTGEGPFLRTGDLGFFLGEELFIAGRLKDLIIIRGRNHYPQDIELTVERSHVCLRPSGGAAFSVEVDGEERLVILQEADRGALKKTSPDEAFAAIRKAVSLEHELQPYAIFLVKRRSILKTSSGKIMRRACKQAYLNQELHIEAAWQLSTAPKPMKDTQPRISSADLREWIVTWMAQRLEMPVSDIDPDDSLAAYGVDSVMVAEFEAEISTYVGFEWPVMDMLITDPSINEVAARGAKLVKEQG
jgi:acyl-CoA synthetase (AMP-forming)/AMP-acid ligase II